jgi:nicotinate-nucleotide pyrophosphorylase (carboxylating)
VGLHIPSHVREFIKSALEEDIGTGDITTELLIPGAQRSLAVLIAKNSFVLAGMPFAVEVFRAFGEDVTFESMCEEGSRVKKATVLANISGSTTALLTCERVALNILQRLSGIATVTSRFVKKTEGLNVSILDTRKTTPGMRYMEKYAVRAGGGENHRSGLYDGILIKDNHIESAGGIGNAVALAKKGSHLMKVEVEAENIKDVREALKAGADIIMLDNMTVADIKKAVGIVGGKAIIEASGNVSLDNVRAIAETGVDLISVGALTHSAPSADISMKLVETTAGEI